MNEAKQGIDSSQNLRNLNMKRKSDPNQYVKSFIRFRKLSADKNGHRLVLCICENNFKI